MSEYKFEIASDADRKVLAGLRASQWHGYLSTPEFAKRNEVLYAHPFGRRITTYCLRGPSGIATSMDVLGLSIGTRVDEEPPTEKDGYLIASVITPSEFRGRGLATDLLQRFLEQWPGRPGILHSDIGPEFYERLDFAATLRGVHERPILSREKDSWKAISFTEGVRRLKETRWRRLRVGEGNIGLVLPDEEFLDWQLARYRYFAELERKPFPADFFYEVSQSHALFLVPNFRAQKAEILWREAECENCLAAAGAIASGWGLSTLSYWGRPEGSPKKEYPMIRVPGTAADFADPQLCDWW